MCRVVTTEGPWCSLINCGIISYRHPECVGPCQGHIFGTLRTQGGFCDCQIRYNVAECRLRTDYGVIFRVRHVHNEAMRCVLIT